MKKWFVLLMLVLLSSSATAEEDYWQQFVHYKMNVRLEPETHMLTGTSSILYQNNSPDTLTMFYMHLYPNGFRSPQSLRAKEAKAFYVALNTDTSAVGWIDITQFRILPADGEAETGAAMSAFEIDDTILKATLPNPLPPGGKVRIELEFASKVRKHNGRAGYRGTQYDFAQWYPKVCVYDENGWNNVPFHLQGEFYGEFGTFDVTMDVPFEYIVASTGVVTDGDPGWSLVQVDTSLSDADWQQAAKEMKEKIKQATENTPRRTVSFHAENVHDFAWITSPDFLYEKGEWDGIPIHVLYRSYVKSRWTKKVTERGNRALAWLSDKFGRYPYPQLSITHGLLGGGMEYPMLVMNASESEGLILHEVGHIYFYGILGNNETKEAWLDEGFTSFQTRWYMEDRYGAWGYDRESAMANASWLQKKRPGVTSRESNRDFALQYMSSGHNEPISKWSQEFKDGLGYSVNAYTKGSIFYEMLRYVVGDETFQKIVHEYFARWKFKHVNEARFKAVCEDVSGMDLDWFFQQWLHDTPTVNYTLGHVSKTRMSDGSYETNVEIKREDSGIMPVEVEITLPDRSKQVQRWDGREKSGTLTFRTSQQPKQVVLDPDNAVMDHNLMGQGQMKLEIYPEYPRMFYNPPDAYVVTWKPNFWYNDVDGLRSGIRFNGSYRNNYNFSLQTWFGAESKKLDGTLKYSPKGGFQQGSNYTIYGGRMEGRSFGTFGLTWNKGKYLFQGPQHRVNIGYTFTRLDDPAYAFTEYDVDGKTVAMQNWSAGDDGFIDAGYRVNPRGISWQSDLQFNVRAGASALGSDVDFTRLDADVKLWWPGQAVGVYLRGYAGAFVGNKDDLPVQHTFSAFGADYHEQFLNSRLSRSRGAFFTEAHYHKPGGGNLRGFYDRPELLGDQIVSANLELRKNVKLPVLDQLLIRRFLGSTEMTLFGDVGSISQNDKSETLADAGIGFYFQKNLPDKWYTFITGTSYRVRIDFPVWVNEPLGSDDNLKFRYVLSFERAL